MSKLTFEQKIIAARPDGFKINQKFVNSTMRAIKHSNNPESFISSFINNSNEPKKGLFMKLKKLPATSLIALIFLTLVLTSGAVYAAVRYLPDLLKITEKNETSRGTTEYFVSEFENCLMPFDAKVKKFELKKDAPDLSDEEVTKIIQAKCELTVVNDLVKNIWPEYTYKDPADGSINDYLASVERPIHFKNIDNGVINTYYDVEGEYEQSSPIAKTPELKAYFSGRQIPVSNIKHGDTVILIAKSDVKNNKEGLGAPTEYIGIIKLTLPFEYYEEKQLLLTDLNECIGNPGELCPNTGGIDVYPAGEGMGGNEELVIDRSKENREISGKIVNIKSDSIEVKSSSGSIYLIIAPYNAFADYNSVHAQKHVDGDAKLKIGSHVNIRYYKIKGQSSKKIVPSEIEQISLLIDAVDYKEQPLKQY